MESKELMEIAKNNQENCFKEIAETLKKYGCELHWKEIYVDGQIIERGFFPKFNPGLFMNPQG